MNSSRRPTVDAIEPHAPTRADRATYRMRVSSELSRPCFCIAFEIPKRAIEPTERQHACWTDGIPMLFKRYVDAIMGAFTRRQPGHAPVSTSTPTQADSHETCKTASEEEVIAIMTDEERPAGHRTVISQAYGRVYEINSSFNDSVLCFSFRTLTIRQLSTPLAVGLRPHSLRVVHGHAGKPIRQRPHPAVATGETAPTPHEPPVCGRLEPEGNLRDTRTGDRIRTAMR